MNGHVRKIFFSLILFLVNFAVGGEEYLVAPTPETSAAAAPSITTTAKPPVTSPIRLFGKMEFKGKISTLPQWVRVIEEHAKNSIFKDDTKLNANTTWADLKKYLTKFADKKAQLKAVNAFWNKWPYRPDPDTYGQDDYWAAPYEFLRTSGDCEDYAIVKYFTLKELGFLVDDLRIVIVRDTIRNIAHAVLVVYLDDEAWVLDNLNNAILAHTFYKNYDAQYGVNENFRWGYVKPKAQ